MRTTAESFANLSPKVHRPTVRRTRRCRRTPTRTRRRCTTRTRELLAVVDALRKAYPPEEPLWDATSPEAPVSSVEPRRCERKLEALERLSRLLALPGAPLLPLQFEVLFRQLVHVLLVVRSWGASGTAEETLRAVLLALQLLVERPLIRGVYGAELLSAARLRGVAGQALSELLDAARAQRSVALRVAAVRVVERLCAMPLAPDVAGFFLPGVASRLCALCPPDEKARSPVQLAVLKALRALLLGPMLDQLNGAALNADYEALEAVDYRQPAAVSAWLHAVHERARSAAGRPPAAALGAGRAPESRDAVDAAVAERVALARAERPRPPASAEELAVVRDGEWLRATAARLRPHVRGVYAACGRGSWRVRRALVVFAVSLCVDGARSLAACVPDALDVVCTAVCDAYPQVRRAARFGLRKLAERLGHTAALVAPIGHNFERQLAGLPAAVRTLGDRLKQRALHALAAQLEILGRARASRRCSRRGSPPSSPRCAPRSASRRRRGRSSSARRTGCAARRAAPSRRPTRCATCGTRAARSPTCTSPPPRRRW